MVTTTRYSFYALFSVTVVLMPLSGCALSPPAPQALAPIPDVVSTGEEVTIVENLDAPWSIAFDEGTALISERDSARIVEVASDGEVREVGRIDDVAAGGEGGLLGIAVDDGWLYAYSTGAEGNRVQRFALLGPLGSLELGEPETILAGIPAATSHNGGRIGFGPDGMLYVTVGDAGDPGRAQDQESLSGKILRVTPDGDIPADNPFEGSPVYSLGHRNPQGLTWADDGTLYASEFGQDTWDELNVIEAGSNYGWPTVEGIAGRDGFIDPVRQWTPDAASPSGIAFARGSIFVANLRGERLREVPLDDLAASAEHYTGEYGRLRDVTVAPDGALWLLTNNTDGRGDSVHGDDRVIRLPLQ